jgi:hypothetical protein
MCVSLSGPVSQIEGTQSSLSDLLLFELEEAPGVPFDDVVEVSNYVGPPEKAATTAGQQRWFIASL